MSATAPTYNEFIELCPEFETPSISRARIEMQIALSSITFSKGAWGEFYSQAVVLDAAHTLAISAMAGKTPTGSIQAAVGPITGAGAAGVNTSFATAAPEFKSKAGMWYSKTSYGQQLLLLQSRIICPGELSA
jgi:hypothetical protein